MPKSKWGNRMDKFWEKLEESPMNRELLEFNPKKYKMQIRIASMLVCAFAVGVVVWVVLYFANIQEADASGILDGPIIQPVHIHHQYSTEKFFGVPPKAYTIEEHDCIHLKLPERAERWKETHPYFGRWTEEDYQYLLYTVIGEAQNCTWEEQIYVASVVLNRLASKRFKGDTIKDIVLAPNQYACFNSNLIYRKPTETNKEATLYVLENGSQLPPDVVFQALFKQGDGVYCKMEDTGTYFCYLENY